MWKATSFRGTTRPVLAIRPRPQLSFDDRAGRQKKQTSPRSSGPGSPVRNATAFRPSFARLRELWVVPKDPRLVRCKPCWPSQNNGWEGVRTRATPTSCCGGAWMMVSHGEMVPLGGPRRTNIRPRGPRPCQFVEHTCFSRYGAVFVMKLLGKVGWDLRPVPRGEERKSKYS